jgi:thiol-disulfide isomerase/thioredoxin
VAATKWWESHPALPNLRDVDGLDALLSELEAAGDALVVLDVYGTWCGACRAVFPKFVKLAEQHSDVVFLKMAFDDNKAVARALGVKALPAFLCFRGDDGKLDCFTAGPSKAGVLAAAIERHNSPRCQLGAPAGVPELAALAAERRAAAEVALAGASNTGAAGVA